MEEVPNYTDNALIWFLVLFVLELALSKKGTYGFSDTLTGYNASILYMLFKFGKRSFSAIFYEDLYNRFCIYQFPWNSYEAWFLCLLTTDFFYYFAHRALHEVGFLWAFHQMHHSSEHFNLTVSMRQGFMQDAIAGLFDLLQVFIIPPPIYLVHRYFLLLRQLWLHFSWFPNLGPLEYIFVTSNTHRVHHGVNKYCIDKNYGGTFIIWDILFGTYAKPRDDEEIKFGLVEPVRSHDQFWLQYFEFKYFGWDKPHMKDKDGKKLFPGFFNKIKAAFMPPGYFPGSKTKQFFFWRSPIDPTEGIPDPDFTAEVYSRPLSLPLKLYLVVNTAVLTYAVLSFNLVRLSFTWTNTLLTMTFFSLRIQMYGYYMDHKWFATLFDVGSMIIAGVVAHALGHTSIHVYCLLSAASATLLYMAGSTPKSKID